MNEGAVRPFDELEIVMLGRKAWVRGADFNEALDKTAAFLGQNVCPVCPERHQDCGSKHNIEMAESGITGDGDLIDLLIQFKIMPDGDEASPVNQMAKERLASRERKQKAWWQRILYFVSYLVIGALFLLPLLILHGVCFAIGMWDGHKEGYVAFLRLMATDAPKSAFAGARFAIWLKALPRSIWEWVSNRPAAVWDQARPDPIEPEEETFST